MSVERENVLNGLHMTYSGVFSALIAQKAWATSETGALSDLGALHRACGLNSKGEYDTARVHYKRVSNLAVHLGHRGGRMCQVVAIQKKLFGYSGE